MSAIVTTFGVGELSAINAIAGKLIWRPSNLGIVIAFQSSLNLFGLV